MYRYPEWWHWERPTEDKEGEERDLNKTKRHSKCVARVTKHFTKMFTLSRAILPKLLVI